MCRLTRNIIMLFFLFNLIACGKSARNASTNSIDRIPIISIEIPLSGSTLSGLIDITWTVDNPANVKEVSVYLDTLAGSLESTLLTIVTTGNHYRWDSATVVDGTAYQIRVIATSSGAKESQPNSVSDLVIDNTPPIVPLTPSISLTPGGVDALDIIWGAANDSITSQDQLQYKVVYKRASDPNSDLNEIKTILDSANEASAWTANNVSGQMTGLLSAERYNANILVKDLAGNISLYVQVDEHTDAAGILDSEFNNGKGYLIHHNAAGAGLNDIGNDIAIDQRGAYIVTGASDALPPILNIIKNRDMIIWRVNTDGSLDLNFKGTATGANRPATTAGYVIHNSAAGGDNDDAGLGLFINKNNQYLVGGHSTTFNVTTNTITRDVAIWRLNEIGSYVNFSNGKGWVTYSSAGDDQDDGMAILESSNGDIYVAGQSFDGASLQVTLWRYRSNVFTERATGRADTDFGFRMVRDAIGQIWIAGVSTNPTAGFDDVGLWRFTSNGVFDKEMYLDNVLGAGIANHDGSRDIAIDSLGRVIMTGLSKDAGGVTNMVTWRFLPTWNLTQWDLDLTFNGGFVKLPAAQGHAVAVDQKDRVIVAGVSGGNMKLWRYNELGIVDKKNFGQEGVTNFAGGLPRAMVIDQDGKIIVTGALSNGNNSDMAIWRYR